MHERKRVMGRERGKKEKGKGALTQSVNHFFYFLPEQKFRLIMNNSRSSELITKVYQGDKQYFLFIFFPVIMQTSSSHRFH